MARKVFAVVGIAAILFLTGCSRSTPVPVLAESALDSQHARLIFKATGDPVRVMFSSGPATLPGNKLEKVGYVFDPAGLERMGSAVVGLSKFMDSFGSERSKSLPQREKLVHADEPIKVRAVVSTMYRDGTADYDWTCALPVITFTPKGDTTYLFEYLVRISSRNNRACKLSAYEMLPGGERTLIGERSL